MTGWRPGFGVALGSWLEARLYVAAAFIVTHAVHDRLGSSPEPSPVHDGLLAWDGRWYQSIATSGYADAADPALRFFPLWPLLGRVLGGLTGADRGFILVVLANAGALMAAALLHRLVVEETGDWDLARRSVRLLALAPPSFVLVLAYSEAFYLTLALAVFLLARRQRWWAVAAAGYLAGLTRPVGVLLALPVALTVVTARAQRRPGAIAAALAPVAGTATFLVWSGLALGEFTAPLTRQRELRSLAEPVSRVVRAAYRGLRGDEGELLHFLAAVTAISLTLLVVRRLGRSMALYCGANLIVMLTTGNLNSLERYGLAAFPLVIAAAMASRHRYLDRWILDAAAAGMVSLTILALSGVYVP